jgi:hypothetical protein
MRARALAGPAAVLRRVGDAFRSVADRTPPWVGPGAFVLVTAIGIGVAIYGTFFADPGIRVRRFDAGPVSLFAIRELRAYPDVDLYIVGLDDGRLRALDGRVQATDCSVEWRPDDARGAARNPGGLAGAFVDPCSAAVWDMLGNAIAGGEVPLRTPQVTYHAQADGQNHAFVEMINHPAFP